MLQKGSGVVWFLRLYYRYMYLDGSFFCSNMGWKCLSRHQGYGSCVCVFVCYHTSCYIPHFYVENRVIGGNFQIFKMWLLLRMLCSIVLASFADHRGLPRSLMSSRCFLSTRRVCTVSDSFYNTINSSLIMAHSQISFLAFCVCLC